MSVYPTPITATSPHRTFHNLTLTAYAVVVAGCLTIIFSLGVYAGAQSHGAAGVFSGGRVSDPEQLISTVGYLNTKRIIRR